MTAFTEENRNLKGDKATQLEIMEILHSDKEGYPDTLIMTKQRKGTKIIVNVLSIELIVSVSQTVILGCIVF